MIMLVLVPVLASYFQTDASKFNVFNMSLEQLCLKAARCQKILRGDVRERTMTTDVLVQKQTEPNMGPTFSKQKK